MMKLTTIFRCGAALTATAALLLSAGCGGGNTDTRTEGANAAFSSSNSSFDYKTSQTVGFAGVIEQMKSKVPSTISGTQTFVSIYTGSSDSRNQLALLTAELYQNLAAGTVSSDGLGVEIPLGTTTVYYEIFGEDTDGNAIATVSGSVNL